MKKSYLPLLLLPVLFFLMAPQLWLDGLLNDPYPFPHRDTPIASVEILHNRNPGGYGIDEANMVLLYTMDPAEIPDFMAALYALPTRQAGTPPSQGYGPYVVRVTYDNGDREMFGYDSMDYIEAGQETTYGMNGYIFSPREDFFALLDSYVDLDRLPDPPPLP